MIRDKKQYTFMDLFAGCGGLSEGFYKQGYKALLHLEIDKTACKTLKTRMLHYNYDKADIERAVFCTDITAENVISELDLRVGEEIDVIIGGPPCQAFSTVGRAQSPDSMSNDPRNYLFENYLSILNHFHPKMFVFENVKGILSAKPQGVKIFDKIIQEMSKTYNVLSDPNVILLNAAEYGVPQLRERVILIGVRKDIDYIDISDVYNSILKTHSDSDDNLPNYRTVRDAISDLPALRPGEGANMQYVGKDVIKNEYIKIIGNDSGMVYNHVARNHNELDRARYSLLSRNKGWQLKDLQQVRPDLVHHDPKHFGNRYTVQEFDKPGKTVVAHLYKDGNLFIHPDPEQTRTFTVREAARVQSFPDDFIFEGSRTEQYKQVGNAVPPLLAEALAKAIKKYLDIIAERELEEKV